MSTVTIDTVEILLSPPIANDSKWIGQAEPMRQLLACWHVLGAADIPLTPRIIGYPGIGKTTLGMTAARERNQPVYIMQCTADTRPEDLLITPVLSEKGKISYHASPLLTAVITGGIAIIDEGNRMSEKSWASLAPLFDNRRMVESIIAGISITAHKEFRAAVTMNDDSSTFEVPDYIMSRLQPGIRIPFPSREDELRILTYSIPFSDEEVLDLCVNFLQKAHGLDLTYSIRDGINAIRYTLKLKATSSNIDTSFLFNNALKQILGEDALNLEKQAIKRRLSGEQLPSMQLGDFFFNDDEELNPDVNEDH
jgi:MoxR-like ATPase